jgi:hypothetical protein
MLPGSVLFATASQSPSVLRPLKLTRLTGLNTSTYKSSISKRHPASVPKRFANQEYGKLA